MSPSKITKRVVVDRLDWIEKMIEEIKLLPLNDYETFIRDKRNIWAAESCLRRGLEALMDLGRHVLAKGFGRGVTEYKEIATTLQEYGVLKDKESATLKVLAGFRNRMVHFYHEVSDRELFEICSSQLSDITDVSRAIKKWINGHQELIDDSL
ncbi:MAG: DUF86 domain-containing protein [Deltaproteobacteria bacterium]|nr:DUF86 domain-containing protein [Deltaproteobacteria bacterium]MBW2344502.1 DUF86 domain-containing protein [Deltaproteobacteria bacterium]